MHLPSDHNKMFLGFMEFFRKFLSSFLISILVFFQSFFYLPFVYAQEATPSAAETTGPSPSSTSPEALPTPAPSPLPDQLSVSEASSSSEIITSEPVAISSATLATPLWTGISGTYTTEVLRVGVTYHFPSNEKVSLTFSKLPEGSGTVTVREHEAYHFELTSSMENGTFEFDLTLPTDAPKKQVLSSEDGQDYEEVSNETVVYSDVITIKGIAHLTHFIVANSLADFNHVVINEIVSNTTGGEWVELYNPTSNSIDLSAWDLMQLTNPSTTPSEAPFVVNGLTGTIEPNSFLVFTASELLNNTGDWIGLYNDGGELIDQVSFGNVTDPSYNQNTVDNPPAEESSGRIIDGGPSFQTFASPTRGLSNGTMLNTLYVDDNWTSPDNDGGHTWGFDAFSSIQDAINFASSGSTINVEPGTYDEALVVNKSLALLGSGIDGASLATINYTGCDYTVSIMASNVTVSGFDIANDCGETNIYIGSSLDNVNITDNIIRDGYEGIYTNGSTNTIIQNNEIKINIYGIYLTGNISGSQVTDNNIHDNEEGISANGATFSEFSITNNQVVDNNDGYGVYFGQVQNSSSTLTIANNNISGNSNGGIYMNSVINSTLNIQDNSAISNNGQYGIYLGSAIGSTVTISGNTIQNNTSSGLYLSGTLAQVSNSTVSISGNTISSNGGDGIYADVITNSTFSILNNTQISGNGGNGVYICADGYCADGSTITISGNTVDGNTSQGVYLYDVRDTSTVGISNNTISSSGETGIYLDSAVTNTTISGNSIENNGLSSPFTGIVVNNASGNKANNNTISGNGSIEAANNDGVNAFNATLNWWGSASAADIFNKISGLVTFSPWYTDAARITTATLKTGKAIASFNFASPSVVGAVNESTRTVTLYVPNGTDVTSLVPTIEISQGATIYPSSGDTQGFTNPVTYTVTAEDTSTREYVVTVNVITANQTVPNSSGNATLNNTNPQVVIASLIQDIIMSITSGTTNPTINFSALISGGTGTIPKTTINSTLSNIVIPASTTVTSADTSWNGVLAAPTITTVSLPQTSGQTKTLGTAIEVGFSSSKLSFDKGVRLVVTGEAGKRAGYSRPGTDFTEITATCAADNQTTGDALATDGDCKIDVGADLVIWTKHFTKFATYTQSATPAQSSTGSQALSAASPPSCGDSKPGSAPKLLSAVASTNSVTLTWDKASGSVSYYLVNYSRTAGKFEYGNPNVGGQDATSYTVGGLSGGTTYYFKLRAGNGCAPGDYSNEISATPGGGFISTPAVGFAAGVLGAKTDTLSQTPVSEVSGVETEQRSQTETQINGGPQVSRSGFVNFFTNFLGAIFSFIAKLLGR